MGDAFYALLVHLFVTDANRHLGETTVVLSSLCDLSVAVSCLIITAVLIWFTCKSVLMRSTYFIYVAMTVLVLSALERLTHIFAFASGLDVFFDSLSMVAALAAAVIMVRERDTVLGMVYQFKYVVGLLRSLDKLEGCE